MSSVERVTVTLPNDLIRDIDRREKNRSKFVIQAVRNELDRRRHEDLRLSLNNPHPDSTKLEEAGFATWAQGLPIEDCESIIDTSVGVPIRWTPGKGWVEGNP